MSTPTCSCEKFDRLEGASFNAYIAAFLEDLGKSDPQKKNRFRCRVCKREWEKRTPEGKMGSARPSLVRISRQ